jgi:hypothetical protein
MNKKSFFLGIVTGIAITFIVLLVIGLVNRNSADNDPIQDLEQPVSYENKKETSFKVFQVLGNTALATEASDEIADEVVYYGNTVLILGENYYSGQVVNVKNPQRVGTYNYTNKGGMPMTVPVIDGEIKFFTYSRLTTKRSLAFLVYYPFFLKIVSK